MFCIFYHQPQTADVFSPTKLEMLDNVEEYNIVKCICCSRLLGLDINVRILSPVHHNGLF